MLILVRHGRTAANAQGLLQGRIDLSLDDVGHDQARQVAAAIGSVDEVISSSLARARETAAYFDAPHTADDRWIELDFGEYDGQPLAAIPTGVWDRWRGDPDYSAAGGESMRALDLRVRAACADVIERARSTNVVVVSHVSPIKAAVVWAMGGDITMSWRLHLDQAGVCRVTAGSGAPVLRSFNEVLYGPTAAESG